jgi:parallel beta-helix repeat protein
MIKRSFLSNKFSTQKLTKKFTQTGVAFLVAIVCLPFSGTSAYAATTPIYKTTGTYENNNANLVYAGAWSTMYSGSDSGGNIQYLNGAGSVSFKFKGTTVQWFSRTTSSSGIANVYIDGVKVASVDRYSATAVYKVKVFEKTGLTDANHEIKIEYSGKKNVASSGKNLLIDSIVIPDTVAPAKLDNIVSNITSSDPTITWKLSSEADVVGYRVYKVDTAGVYKFIKWNDKADNNFTDIGSSANISNGYRITAIDKAGNESVPSANINVVTKNTTAGYRYAGCPTVGAITVSNSTQLKAATVKAVPGSIIRLKPGTYTGNLHLTTNGTKDKPVWICGSRSAIITGGGTNGKTPVTLESSSYTVFSGMTITNGMKGITVKKSHHMTISDNNVYNIGHEGIHLKQNTTDSVVIGNVIKDTGKIETLYGEGIYVGSSKNNWCELTNCKPDKSDRNAIVGNNITTPGSQFIDAKEGTTDGVIVNNIFNGAAGMQRTESWVMVMGNRWSVTSNSGTSSIKHGFQVNGHLAGTGLNNMFADNISKVNGPGYGFELYEVNGKNTSGTILSCSNVVTGAALGFSNVGNCTK